MLLENYDCSPFDSLKYILCFLLTFYLSIENTCTYRLDVLIKRHG
jgi:hypothetical protein